MQPEERKTTIVQNITLGYHFVSDINLQFGPREVKDLTWEDVNIIKKSRDLKESIRRGILKELTEEEYEKTMDLQYQKEQKELVREQQNKMNLQQMKVDEKNMLVDSFDVAKSNKRKSEVDISGTANHPMSYVAAFEIAQSNAAERGDVLTAEEFASYVERDPDLVPKLLSNTKTASMNSQKHNVYYATANGDFGNQSTVVKGEMTNYNKSLLEQTGYDDPFESNFSDDSEGFAEEIIIDVNQND